jgi:3-oxoacyl-[acyl-carrier protein] reductase
MAVKVLSFMRFSSQSDDIWSQPASPFAASNVPAASARVACLHELSTFACEGERRVNLALEKRTALVTGASTGIGRGIAVALAAEGVRLAVVARRRRLLEELEAQLGTKLVIIECDLMSPEAPAQIADAALAGLGSVEILVNNAGGTRRFTLETADAQWDEALTLNFVRQRQLTHRLLPQMMERRWGRIINITGKSEPEGLNGAFPAKAAMHSWAKGLSRVVGRHGITVNSIPPGRILSEQILRNYSPEFRQRESEHDIPGPDLREAVRRLRRRRDQASRRRPGAGRSEMATGPRDGADMQNLHRNKRLLTLEPEVAARARGAASPGATADVLVENYRPDVKAGSASTTSRSRRSIRASCWPASPASGRTGPTATGPASTRSPRA